MRRLICALPLLIAACQQAPQQSVDANQAGNGREPAQPTNLVEPSSRSNEASEPPAVNRGGEGQRADTPLGSLPPADSPLRFVGSWAAKADYCADKAWRFTARALSTPAGSHCDFSNVQKVAGGYDIAAQCTAEGPPTNDRITLRFAESARAMLFESDVIADAGLIYCGK